MSIEIRARKSPNIFVRETARSLARKYNRKSGSTETLLNLVRDQGDSHNSGMTLSYPALIDDMIRVISPKRLVALVEQENLEQFREIVSCISYVRNVFTPLYTLSELGKLLHSFDYHLANSTAHMEGFGLPDRLFAESKWLDSYLNKLYPTKHPAKTKISNGRFHYDWIHFNDKKRVNVKCIYEIAELVSGISQKDALELKKSRCEVHHLKRRIIKYLASAVASRNPDDLWPGCLDIIAKIFDKAAVDFLIQLDADYESKHLGHIGTATFPDLGGSGGLTDTIWVFSCVARELRLGTHATIHEFLMKFISGAPRYTSRVLLDKLIRHLVLINSSTRQHLLREIDAKLGADYVMQEEFYNRARFDLSERFSFNQYQKRGSSTESLATVGKNVPRREYPSLIDDGRTIVMSPSAKYSFSQQQRLVIAILWNNYKEGNEYIAEISVFKEMGLQDASDGEDSSQKFIHKRFKHFFKSTWESFKACFEQHPKQRDLWRYKQFR